MGKFDNKSDLKLDSQDNVWDLLYVEQHQK